ncbi:sensor histidine kinase [Streptococcus oralis]|uniref:Histidine kinase n=1 Tax=Streptococcus oralis subsp. dentisani TaxID=1458253 RepID=A0A1X1J8I3_STROR|nr:sensor histidine kinase [Streptococcus oralis]MCY7090825.1 sensor histidine kinase [Streptococcus oralis]ORO79381.1 histidine kinase [Streptococcus oralis subsp. dentisani]ORO81636.1 histidine kinase [Streptococcus oralis subsp. dentisani]RSJ70652.1 Sensor histidine kinase YehU [Streptococcus oralis subsp. dentisani]
MKRSSLLVRMVISIFLVFLILLALVGTFYYQSSSSAIEATIEGNSQTTISQTSHFIQSYIKKLETTSTSLTQQTDVLAYAENPSQDQAKGIRDLFLTILKADQDLKTVVLVTKSGQVISTDDSVQMKTSSDMMAEDWYQKAIHQGAKPVLTPARKSNSQWVISVTQELVDAKGANLGVLRLDISYETLEAYLNQLQLGQQGFAFIINENHEFVYHPKHTVYSSASEMEAMKPYIETGQGYTLDHQSYVSQEKIAGTDWTVIGVSSLEKLDQVRSQLMWTLLGASALSLLACFCLVWFSLKRWIAPLKDLRETMLEIASGTQNLRAKEAGAYELREVTRQFNAMLDQIDQLMADVRRQEEATRQYELQALSSQINPHFLYNTLDTIIWMAEFQDSQRVVQVTKSLATYFRLALNQGKDLISLSDEINHVRQYLFIQKQRYGDKLEYEIAEDPAFGNLVLPKLVLQPLVENALYHGIKEKEGQGHIKVSVQKKDTGLVIRIEDDGIGFQSTGDSSQSQLKRGGVGLQNVDQRLKLHFGENYQMKIDSVPSKGTTVEIYINKIETS